MRTLKGLATIGWFYYSFYVLGGDDLVLCDLHWDLDGQSACEVKLVSFGFASTDLLPGGDLPPERGVSPFSVLLDSSKRNHFMTNMFFTHTRHFHGSMSVAQLPNHRLYKLVDWEKVEAGFHAVVDPMEPGSILYLTEQDYIRQLRVSLSNDHTLKVLAKAGTSRSGPISTSQSVPTDSSQNSPVNTHPYLDEIFSGSLKSQKKALKRVIYMFKNPFQDLLRVKKDFEGTVKSLMIPVSDRNIRTLLVRWFVELTYWRTGSLPQTVHKVELNNFCLYLTKLIRTQGANALIQRLKIMLFVLNSYLGGNKMSSTQALGVRIKLTHGLPSCFPLYARSALRGHSMRFIHTWVSLLNSYKAMMCEWKKPDLASITAPHPDLSGLDVFQGFRDFVPLFWEAHKIKPIRDPKELSIEVKRPGSATRYDYIFTGKSGPNRGPAMFTVGADALAWRNQPRNFVLEWLNLTGADSTAKWFQECASVWVSRNASPLHRNEKTILLEKSAVYHTYRNPSRKTDWITKEVREDFAILQWKGGPYLRPILRRLHALYEAAGKVRIIAIVDYWTQLVLKPLHSWMFSILKALPQDATFDQEGKLREFSKRGYSAYWCYDLKSATDLIPLRLYEELFKPMLPSGIMALWLELLVGLAFLVPKENFDDRGMSGLKNPSPSDLEELFKANSVKYTCGQPMGALSSWASMALVHHALVLYAAYTTGKFVKQTVPLVRWSHFTAYLILGDDIVIADREVAHAYSSLCEKLGIKIGLAKSFTDSPLLNFANQTYLKDVNISPLSLREELNVRGLPSRAEMALRAVKRGYVDISGNGWVAPLIKLFVRPKTWELIQKDLTRGVNHPIVSWVLSALLAPATDRLSFVKPAASIREYLATMSRKVLFWNKPIKDLATCESGKGVSEFLRAFLLAKAQRIFKEEAQVDRRLEGFESFLLRSAPADIQRVLFMAHLAAGRARLLWWRKTYRSTLMCVTRGAPKDMTDLAYARFCDVTRLDELVPLLHQAEQDLPAVPSYEGKSLKDFFTSSRMPDETKIFRIYQRQMELLRATEEVNYSLFAAEEGSPSRERWG